MGDIRDMIMTISANIGGENDQEKVDKEISKIISAMVKEAKQRRFYKYTTNAETVNFRNEIMDFFKKEGFEVDNYQPMVRNNNGKIIRYPSFEISWYK